MPAAKRAQVKPQAVEFCKFLIEIANKPMQKNATAVCPLGNDCQW